MPMYTVSFGGWYQRTTLHLSEIYDLFELGHSKLALSDKKLKGFKDSLNFSKITRNSGYLEFVQATTQNGIEVRYFEDGLYILELETTDINKSQLVLENYFEKIFNPAISYIFSLGAPTPKVLANIKVHHPTAIRLVVSDHKQYQVDESKFGEVYSTLSAKDISVYKTPGFIFIVSSKSSAKFLAEIVEMQIFFREFKDQLEKYLDIHRNLWEKISHIKEKKTIRGKEVQKTRNQLDSYEKTINLINNRINQMGSYVNTRAAVAKDLKIEDFLTNLFQYKFEVLTNTLGYIKEIWSMTSDYLESAIKRLVEINNKTTNATIHSIQILATIGVISAILGYLTRDELPKITSTGAIYFAVLIIATLLINLIIRQVYKNLRYKLKFTKRASKI